MNSSGVGCRKRCLRKALKKYAQRLLRERRIAFACGYQLYASVVRYDNHGPHVHHCPHPTVSIPFHQFDECMKEDITPRNIVSIIAWIVIAIVIVVIFARMGVGLIVYADDLARELLADYGLQGWALVAIPLLCCVVAGWLAWRYLRGSRRFFALLVCAGLIGDIGLRVVAPNVEGLVREFGQPACHTSKVDAYRSRCSF